MEPFEINPRVLLNAWNPWFHWSFWMFLKKNRQPPWCPWLFLHLLFCPRRWPWRGGWFRASVIRKSDGIEMLNYDILWHIQVHICTCICIYIYIIYIIYIYSKMGLPKWCKTVLYQSCISVVACCMLASVASAHVQGPCGKAFLPSTASSSNTVDIVLLSRLLPAKWSGFVWKCWVNIPNDIAI